MTQTYVTVCGKYLSANGEAPLGTVTFTPRVNGATDLADLDLLSNLQVRAALDSTGSFSVDLVPTDDPARSPRGWTYQVEESILGATRRTYDISVPIAAAGGPCLSLSSLAPVPPANGGTPAVPSLAAFSALLAEFNSVLATGFSPPLYLGQRAETPNALLPVMTFGPRITDTGPNAAATVGNPTHYPVWVLAGDGVTQIPNPAAPWIHRGYAHEWPTLVQPSSNQGPYLVHKRPLDLTGPDAGPSWYDFFTDAPDLEIDYLSAVAALWRIYVDDPQGPNGAGIKAVTTSPETLTASGGNLWRHRYSFGLSGIAAPTGTAAAGGTLTAGNYHYRITTIDGNGGETSASSPFSITIGGGNGTINLSWAAPGNTVAGNPDRTIASYNVYRTVVGGAGTEQFIGNSAVTSFSDTGIASGGATLLRLFSATSGRRMRRVIIESHFAYFGGLTLNKADTVYASLPAPKRVLFIGDSLTQGTASNFTPFSYAAQAAQRLGFQDPDVYGVGGTGYIAAPVNTPTFTQRLSGVNYTPDLIVTAGGRNDVGQSAAALAVAVGAYLDAVHTAWPNTPHIVLSPWYSADANVTAVGTAVAAACAAATPVVPYVDLLAAGIITGTGTTALPTGNGNADSVMFSDRVHWTLAGHELVAEAVATNVEALLIARGEPVATGAGLGTQTISVPGSGLYQVPAGATMVMFEGLAGGGGGGGGDVQAGAQPWCFGGGGGGGAGRSTKWVSAAQLRAAYPGGIPYTVGGGGAGGVPGLPGTDGGFTFAGDFFACTPGRGGTQGGSIASAVTFGLGGANGLGDTYGGFGGLGGALLSYTQHNYTSVPDATGGQGGFILVYIQSGLTYSGAYYSSSVQTGGGGGGGGGGGIAAHASFNGGSSGFPTTSDPTPLFGLGGIKGNGGALPTAAGTSVIGPGVTAQGGGGGGASIGVADAGTTAQSGASALPNSGSGGGGGGSADTGKIAGSGGSGGSGYLSITAI